MDIFSCEEERIGIFELDVALILLLRKVKWSFFFFVVSYLLLPFLISHCSVMSILTWFLAEME